MMIDEILIEWYAVWNNIFGARSQMLFPEMVSVVLLNDIRSVSFGKVPIIKLKVRKMYTMFN